MTDREHMRHDMTDDTQAMPQKGHDHTMQAEMAHVGHDMSNGPENHHEHQGHDHHAHMVRDFSSRFLVCLVLPSRSCSCRSPYRCCCTWARSCSLPARRGPCSCYQRSSTYTVACLS